MTDSRTGPRRTNDSPIARIRLDRGLTQAQLAEMIGCPRQTIARWETGVRVPSLTYLVKLSRALGCSLDEFAQ